jgi:hypothetical protein
VALEDDGPGAVNLQLKYFLARLGIFALRGAGLPAVPAAMDPLLKL